MARLFAPPEPPDSVGTRLDDKAMAFHIGSDPVRVRRMLERPFGSVRFNANVPDRYTKEAVLLDCERGK